MRAAALASLALVAACHSTAETPTAEVGSVPQPAAAAPKPEESSGDLVAHEWGTFTTMQGSNGMFLDGLQHESEALPAFVHASTRAHDSPFHLYGDESHDVHVRSVTSKMETPVLYFYSNVARNVHVHVDFDHGLLTHWYPAAKLTTPIDDEGSIDVSKLDRSSLDWSVDLVPASSEAPRVPDVEATNPWEFAREVKAAYVKASGREGEAERYIFYRGLGKLALPLHVDALGNGLFLTRNMGSDPISKAFLLEVGPGGARYLAVEKPASVALPLMQKTLEPTVNVLPKLSADVEAALVAEGLYADEARAMVRTWSRTWFEADGTRMIYMVPRTVTDRILPLAITPEPKSLVRVLVGRDEILTPEDEKAIEETLAKVADPAKHEEGMKELAKRGRFLEPSLRRVVAQGRAPVVEVARKLLAEMK